MPKFTKSVTKTSKTVTVFVNTCLNHAYKNITKQSSHPDYSEGWDDLFWKYYEEFFLALTVVGVLAVLSQVMLV